jgi:4-amino-4-deoxy-L-arabinose transferase-like glycosyltransferase
MLVLAATAAIIFFVNLGRAALLDWDEAIYAEISRESVRTHHWLTPYWEHYHYFDKPPLSLWIRTALFRIFGVSEFWARAESALAGIAIVLLTYALVRRAAGWRAGLFAGFVLLTIKAFLHNMRQVMCDGPLSVCIYLALYAYVRLREGHGKRSWYLLCAAIGLGAMVKGPAIAVAPAAILIDWVFRREEKLDLRAREYWLGAALVVAIVAPWHLWMYLHYGNEFLRRHFGHEVIARALQPLDGNSGGPLFYFGIIAAGAFPWSLLVPVALVRGCWRREWEYRLPWILVFVTLGLYTLVTTKLDQYVIPVYPALAMELGRLLAVWTERRRVLHYATVAVLGAGLVIAFIRLMTFPGFAQSNAMGRLATLAKTNASRNPLLLIGGPQDDVDGMGAMYYSDRFATSFVLPNEANRFADYMQSNVSGDVIMTSGAIRQLSARYRLQPLAVEGGFLYAVISYRVEGRP